MDADNRARSIDAALRTMISSLMASGTAPALRPLSLFPTPRYGYFRAHLAAAACKPHLRAFGRELFGRVEARAGQPHGGTFTRFMITGFATFRALEALGADSYESYPDLQFRLWSHEPILPPKGMRTAALNTRRRIVAELAVRIGIGGCENIRTLDAADAAILALSTAAGGRRGGSILVIEHSAEGRFLVAVDSVADRSGNGIVSQILAAAG